MTIYEATMIAEGATAAENEQRWIDAWQMLHDTGVAYELQGWFGRMAHQLLEEGVIE